MTNASSMASRQSWRVARALGRGLMSQNANSVWSPACVASLLAVAREGASGTTRHELDALLDVDNRLGTGNFLEKDDTFGEFMTGASTLYAPGSNIQVAY